MNPDNAVPGTVAVQFVLGRSDRAVVSLSGLRAYPSGFEFILTGHLRRLPGATENDVAHERVFPDLAGRPIPRGFLQLGVRFADGRATTNLHRPSAAGPTGPVLIGTGGGGDGWRDEMGYWVWPLPPPGPVTFFCQWLAHGIDECQIDVDAAEILDGAARSIPLWPADRSE